MIIPNTCSNPCKRETTVIYYITQSHVKISPEMYMPYMIAVPEFRHNRYFSRNLRGFISCSISEKQSNVSGYGCKVTEPSRLKTGGNSHVVDTGRVHVQGCLVGYDKSIARIRPRLVPVGQASFFANGSSQQFASIPSQVSIQKSFRSVRLDPMALSGEQWGLEVRLCGKLSSVQVFEKTG
jgi:hypothetical protein